MAAGGVHATCTPSIMGFRFYSLQPILFCAGNPSNIKISYSTREPCLLCVRRNRMQSGCPSLFLMSHAKQSAAAREKEEEAMTAQKVRPFRRDSRVQFGIQLEKVSRPLRQAQGTLTQERLGKLPPRERARASLWHQAMLSICDC